MRPHTASISIVQRTALTGAVVVTAVLHCAAIFVLYRGRVVTRWRLSDTDFVVFLLPTLVAFVAYLVLLTGMVKRIGARLGLAILFTIVSGWASLFVSFNTYGT